MNALTTVKRGVDAFLRWFCIVLFAVLLLLVLWQVFIRQVLSSGQAATEVLARTVFIWQGLIGAAYVIGENDDVAIDFLVRKFPAAVAKGIMVLAHAVVAFFAVWVLIYGGWLDVENSWTTTVQLLPVTQGQLHLVLPITGVLIVFYCLIHIIDTIARPLDAIHASDAEKSIDDLTDEGI